MDNSSCIGNSNKIYHSFVTLSTMRNVRQAARAASLPTGAVQRQLRVVAAGSRRGETGTGGGCVAGNRTVSGNESWRRIAICNFMAASLETEGAQKEHRSKQLSKQERNQRIRVNRGGGSSISSRSSSRNRSRETATDIAAIQNKPI